MNKQRDIHFRKTKRIAFFAIIFSLSCSMATSIAQEDKIDFSKIDINTFIKETQKTSEKSNAMTMVWWVPEEYWTISLKQNPNMTTAMAEDILKVVMPYTLIAIVDGEMGPFGGITYKPEELIRANIQIRDNDGTLYRPLSKDNIDANMKIFLSTGKSVFINMLGPMGENMHFFLFPSKNEKGQRIADAKGRGSFSVKLSEKEFQWRLPLNSLLPPSTERVCVEEEETKRIVCGRLVK